MHKSTQFSLCYFLITMYLRVVSCSHGCVSLDTYSFEKIVSKFKASLVKFDTAYPYGKKQEEYEKLCTASHNVADLLVAEIAVKDYGEKDNAELGEKYGVFKDDFPSVKLFVRDQSQPIDFEVKSDDEFTEEKLKEFVWKVSNVYIGLHGCLEEFDKIAQQFVIETEATERKQLLKEAEQLWDKTVGNSQHKSAQVYVKYMRKILESNTDGVGFIQSEINRLNGILSQGKLSDNKKQELEKQMNILRAFRFKDEL